MSREFRMGGWLIEPDLNRISRSNRSTALEPKILEVLICLAEHPGQVLSKEKIIQAVWPDTFVGDGIVSYAISELRRAFGDDARKPRIIETISRKGYRLVAPVYHVGAVPRSRPSIAVLPFSDLSIDKGQQYFCDGITEEVISSLARMASLRVASRTSCCRFKGKPEDVRTIGRKLGVDAILEGSVRREQNRLRITAQLINVDEGCQLWSEKFDRDVKDVFSIQDEISRSIASALRVTLSPEETVEIGKIPTTDIHAYDYCLRGKQFFSQYSRKGVEFALRMYFQAIALDPAYARAHAGIADCCAFLYLYAGRNEAHREQADSASKNAIALEPGSAEAHASRGTALSLQGDYAAAESEFQTAVHLDPMLFEAYYLYARAAFSQGKLEKAIELYERSIEVNPLDYQAPLLSAQVYSDLGREEEARAARRRGVRNVEQRLLLHPEDTRALYMGANGLVALGEREKGLEWARQAIALDPDEPMLLYNVACIQSLAGRLDEALDSLERAVISGLSEKSWIEQDSNLDRLRDHPRYHALIRSLGQNAPGA